MNTAVFKFAGALVAWALLYFATGYVSLVLSDPVTRVAAVWFPAGVAVAAFLITRRARWPMLFLCLLLSRIGLDATSHHAFASSLGISLISLCSDMLTGWLVLHFSRRSDILHAVLIWIFWTLVVSALAACVGVGWLAHRFSISFVGTVWVWWAANVTGILFGTIVLMGWHGLTSDSARPGAAPIWVGLAAYALLCIVALYTFGYQGAHASRSAMDFALACVPVGLAVVVSVAWGSRGGSVALISLAAIVIYFSAAGRGAFFPRGLRPDEPLLLAQCYLSGCALLLAFVRALAGAQRGGVGALGKARQRAFAYELNLSSLDLRWDDDLNRSLQHSLPCGARTEDFLRYVHVDDQAALAARWQALTQTQSLPPALDFRLPSSAGGWLRLRDECKLRRDTEHGLVVFGMWGFGVQEGWR